MAKKFLSRDDFQPFLLCLCSQTELFSVFTFWVNLYYTWVNKGWCKKKIHWDLKIKLDATRGVSICTLLISILDYNVFDNFRTLTRPFSLALLILLCRFSKNFTKILSSISWCYTKFLVLPAALKWLAVNNLLFSWCNV